MEILDEDPDDDGHRNDDDSDDEDAGPNPLDEHGLREPLLEHLAETAGMVTIKFQSESPSFKEN